MQILPNALKEATQEYSSASMGLFSVKNTTASLFNDFMNSHMNIVAKENTAVSMFVDKAVEQRQTVEEDVSLVSKAVTPKARKSETTPQTLKVTREDFQEMKEGLKEYGLTDEEINEIEDKVESDGGMTWGELVRDLAGKVAEKATTTKEFSREQEQEMTSFFAKLGFSDKQAQELVTKLGQGQYKQVFAAIEEKLGEYPFEEVFPLTAKEVESFAEALGLSKETVAKLRETLGNGQELTPAQMKTFMTAMKTEMASQAKESQDKVDVLGDLVGKTLKNAQDRAELQGLSDRRMQDTHDKVLEDSIGINKEIKDSAKAVNQEQVSKHVREARDEISSQSAASEKQEEAAAKPLFGKGDQKDTAGRIVGESKEQLLAPKNQAATESEEAAPKSKNGEELNKVLESFKLSANGRDSAAKENQDFSSGQDLTGEEKQAWNSFINKVRLGSETAGTARQSALSAEKMEQVLAQATQTAKSQAANTSAKQSGTTQNLNMRRTMEQVQNAIFRNTGQGSKQLNLQLKPEHLGKLNIVLQVKNQEVRALIRAENPETGRMLSEQIQTLKDALEQQGLKVAKVDVQTNLADSESQLAWQDAQSHNQAREREELARWKSQWRTGADYDPLAAAGEAEGLAYAQGGSLEGLHLIA